MNIKTYQAATMQDALQAIKAELGPDAVILSTRQHPPGKGRLGYKMVEVTAAIDIEAVRACVPTNTQAQTRPKPSVGDRPQAKAAMPFGDVLRASLDRETHSAWPEPDIGHSHVRVNRQEEEWQDLHAEMKRIREMLDSRDKASAERTPHAPDLTPCYERLIENGLDTRTVHGLLNEVQSRIPTTASDTLIRSVLHHAIVGRVKTSGPLLTGEERKKTVILVGPTGVGKTTTIAKLAAHYRQHERRSVALVTLDTYRMAAVEQLRMYADLIGVTMDVALTRGDAVRCIARRNEAELILVDTAGRSPGDAVGMTEVRDILSLNHPVEVHLVLSATTRERDLLQHTNHYRGIPFNRLLFTKLDETAGIGGAFDLMSKTRVPLSYFCVGQRVPEDLELAQPERLAELLLGESACAMQEPTRTGIIS
jgi:flagellar biosynthesis protein FlhF